VGTRAGLENVEYRTVLFLRESNPGCPAHRDINKTVDDIFQNGVYKAYFPVAQTYDQINVVLQNVCTRNVNKQFNAAMHHLALRDPVQLTTILLFGKQGP
jgi:hypothetical protein